MSRDRPPARGTGVRRTTTSPAGTARLIDRAVSHAVSNAFDHVIDRHAPGRRAVPAESDQ